jgi:hypothetical protein
VSINRWPRLRTLVAAFMQGTKHPLSLLDVRNLPTEGPFAEWLAKPKLVWNLERNPARSFDEVILVDTVSAASPLK